MTDRERAVTEAEETWRRCVTEESQACARFLGARSVGESLRSANDWSVAEVARRMAWLLLQSLLNRPPPWPTGGGD